MSVRVRMFAALREAAGTDNDTVDAGPLPVILEALCERYGDGFRRRLAISTVLVDGSACPHDAPVTVPDGAEIALLPPVSGGSA